MRCGIAAALLLAAAGTTALAADGALFNDSHFHLTNYVQEGSRHVQVVEELLADPAFPNLHFDISWDEVAKYIVRTPDTVKAAAALFERFPDRFVFGTDEVGPKDQPTYLRVYEMYDPLWRILTPATSEKIRLGNYARLFDEARRKVRAWEQANVQ